MDSTPTLASGGGSRLSIQYSPAWAANEPTTKVNIQARRSCVRKVGASRSPGTNRMYANIDMDFAGLTFPFAKFELWSGIFDGTSSSMVRQGGLVGNGNAGGSNLSGFAVGGLNRFENVRPFGVRHGSSSSRATGAKCRSTSAVSTAARVAGCHCGAWSLSMMTALTPS